MAGMRGNAKSLLEDAGNLLERPEVRFVPVGLGAGDPQGLQATQVFVRESPLAPGAACSMQPLLALGLPQMEPTTGTVPTDWGWAD